MGKKVRIYTTNSCVYCNKAKDFFRKNRIGFEEINVEQDSAKQGELLEKSGQFGVPVIEVEGRMLIGWNEGRFREMMEDL